MNAPSNIEERVAKLEYKLMTFNAIMGAILDSLPDKEPFLKCLETIALQVDANSLYETSLSDVQQHALQISLQEICHRLRQAPKKG